MLHTVPVSVYMPMSLTIVSLSLFPSSSCLFPSSSCLCHHHLLTSPHYPVSVPLPLRTRTPCGGTGGSSPTCWSTGSSTQTGIITRSYAPFILSCAPFSVCCAPLTPFTVSPTMHRSPLTCFSHALFSYPLSCLVDNQRPFSVSLPPPPFLFVCPSSSVPPRLTRFGYLQLTHTTPSLYYFFTVPFCLL